MYESHQDYAPLRDLVDDTIKDIRKTQYPDFSTDGFKIDDLIDESTLHMFNAGVVAEVAALYGFDINVCRYGSNQGTHEQPKIRANGIWLDLPKGLEEKFLPHGEYARLEDPTMCPTCANSYKAEAQKTRDMGAEGIHRFSAGKYLIESARRTD